MSISQVSHTNYFPLQYKELVWFVCKISRGQYEWTQKKLPLDALGRHTSSERNKACDNQAGINKRDPKWPAVELEHQKKMLVKK